MSDKPSLYVVEKKEVVILVILFVLVTVLSFTVGVRYGESLGKKKAVEQATAENEHARAEADKVGGTLGGAPPAATDGHAAAPAKDGDHGAAPAAAGHGHGEEKKADAHGADDHASKPETAPAISHGGDDHTPPAKEAADKNSDEFLLNALKEAGVEPPGGKAPGAAKLPGNVKEMKGAAPSRALSGAYVIQVGSHPSRNEAEAQVRQLQARKLKAEILAPVKDRQGEWHRVVIGNFKAKREADKEAAALKAKGAILSFFVWRLP